VSFYRGPNFIGHALDNPARRAAVFSPVATRASMPIVRSDTSPMLRRVLAVHESAHCTWHWVNRRSVHSVEVHGDGGEFRAVEGAGDHSPVYASNDVTDMLRDSDRKTREGGCTRLQVSWSAAQRSAVSRPIRPTIVGAPTILTWSVASSMRSAAARRRGPKPAMDRGRGRRICAQ